MPNDAIYASVRSVSFGGELTPVQSVRRARSRFPNATINIGFSSTESVQASFSCSFKPEDDLSQLQELLFSPNANIEDLVLLDEDDRPVMLEEGAHGRICVLTKASAEPYIVDDGDEGALEASRDTFRSTNESSKRLICFGDYGEYRFGHKIVVFGRTGRKIKINGVFVDLGFLDRLLAKHKSVKEATTLAVKNRIVCLYIPQDENTLISLEDLNNMLAGKTSISLNQCFAIRKMPIASSGKMDWKSLQASAEELSSQKSFPPIPQDDEVALFVATKMSELLEQPYLYDRNFNFTEIGLDSISAAHLATQLRRRYPAYPMSVDLLMEDDLTPTSLSSALKGGNVQKQSLTRAFLHSEIDRLSAGMKSLPLKPPTRIKKVVLSGATGYLGSFILAQLLQQHPECHIYCIVRSKGMKRIEAALASTRLQMPPDALSRVSAIQGDLAMPDLGLSDADKSLVAQADLVIHNAAAVHWTKSYNTLLAANVLSLVSLLKLAKSLTFVSGGGQTALDDGKEAAFIGQNGYTQTKYVAEGICKKVGARIVRPGYIIGAPVSNADDFLWRFMKTCAQLKAVVKLEAGSAPMNAATVNDVADHVIRADRQLDRIWVE